MDPSFSIRVCSEEDVAELAGLTVSTFAHFPIEQVLGNVDTPEGIQAVTERHLRAYREYKDETGRSLPVKCVHTDHATGEETLAACAQWFIYPEPRTAEQVAYQNYLFSAAWVPEADGRREQAQKTMKTWLDGRIKWSTGRGYGLLQYMATHKAFRRRGAATAIVQWGLDRCKELGVPAYLEASEEGKPVYERLGFEVVDELRAEHDGQSMMFPSLMWWPPGTKSEDKRPLTA